MSYLPNTVESVSLVMDLRIAHDRWGSNSNPSLTGHLRYPTDMDTTLNESAPDKILQYRADYNHQGKTRNSPDLLFPRSFNIPCQMFYRVPDLLSFSVSFIFQTIWEMFSKIKHLAHVFKYYARCLKIDVRRLNFQTSGSSIQDIWQNFRHRKAHPDVVEGQGV